MDVDVDQSHSNRSFAKTKWHQLREDLILYIQIENVSRHSSHIVILIDQKI